MPVHGTELTTHAPAQTQEDVGTVSGFVKRAEPSLLTVQTSPVTSPMRRKAMPRMERAKTPPPAMMPRRKVGTGQLLSEMQTETGYTYNPETGASTCWSGLQPGRAQDTAETHWAPDAPDGG